MLTDEMKAEGWIEHNGGPCPVKAGTSIKTMLRNGSIDYWRCPLDLDDWAHTSAEDAEHPFDIIAYRPGAKPMTDPSNEAMEAWRGAFGAYLDTEGHDDAKNAARLIQSYGDARVAEVVAVIRCEMDGLHILDPSRNILAGIEQQFGSKRDAD